MGIVIKKIDGEYWIHSVSHYPMYNPSSNKFDDCTMWYKSGRVKNLHELKVDIEYDLDIYKDFNIVKRIPQVKHDNLIYDDLFYELKKLTIKRLWQNFMKY